ncbi:MAG: hypothetical protein IT162_00645 [Bryobacterales bacterium]|nr:hypothetical protein [Bryobacterales bacterium]
MGVALSPAPWKLLDDSAIWSQNWAWTPTPERGPVTERFGLCTLCAAGCGVKARCGSAGVFGVAPAAEHPAGGGALCPVVYGAHQLAYHPRRLRTAIVNGHAVETKAAIAEAARRLEAAGAKAAILDERPGRIMSALYDRIAQAKGGTVVTLAQVEDRSLRTMEDLAGVRPGTLGYDFEHAALILSIGAPLLDSWGSTGRMSRLWSRRAEAGKPVFLHAGSHWSRTAQLADRALILLPGSEAAFVAALAGKLSIEAAAEITALSPSSLSDLALRIREQSPALVVGGGEAASSGLPEATERMIAALNVEMGALGRKGGIVARRALAGAPLPPRYLDRLPDQSLSLLVHEADSAGIVTPEALLRRKLAAGGTLVRLSAFLPEGLGPNDILIPSTTFLEGADDAQGSRDAAVQTWSYSDGVSSVPAFAVTPAAFAAQMAEALRVDVEPYEDLRKARAAASVLAKRGHVYRHAGGEKSEVTDLEAFQSAMAEGAVWVDEPVEPKPLRVNLDAVDWRVGQVEKPALIAVASSQRGSLSALPVVPLASKLDRETRLHAVPGEVRMNPRTARELNLKPGDSVSVCTSFGETRGRVRCDAAAIPGQLVLAACGDGSQLVLEAMGAADPGAAPAQAARIRRA